MYDPIKAYQTTTNQVIESFVESNRKLFIKRLGRNAWTDFANGVI
jgi:hypothetical protein